jgi:microcystin-dependent protein
MRTIIGLFLLLLCSFSAQAQIVGQLPVQLQNNTTADATQVMANFNKIANDVNANAAKNGANNDITALGALITPITKAQGGSSNYISIAPSTGSANAQVIGTSQQSTTPPFLLASGSSIQWVPGFTNTGPLTVTAAPAAAIPVKRRVPGGLADLAGGEVVAGTVTLIIYDGTQYQLTTDSTSAVPPGSVFWTVASVAPSGYLLLRGQSVSCTTYATIQALLGASCTGGLFALPDVRGRTIFSVDSGAGRTSNCGGGVLVGTCGTNLGLQTQDQLPAVSYTPAGTIVMSQKVPPEGTGTPLIGVMKNQTSHAANPGAEPYYRAADMLEIQSIFTGTAYFLNTGSSTVTPQNPFYPPAIVLNAMIKY